MSETEAPKKRRGWVTALRYTIGLGLALFLLWVLSLFVRGELIAVEVGGGSMEPTLQAHDRVLARAIRPTEPIQRGDLVIVESPDDNGPDMIKRVVAIPGDTVQFRRQILLVNGEPSPPPGEAQSIHPEAPEITYELGPREYFVLGDNRGTSHDSEQFGPLDRDYIHSRVIYRYGPWSQRGRL